MLNHYFPLSSLSTLQVVRSSPPSSCRRRSTDRPSCCWRRSISCPPWTSSSALPSRSAPTLTIWETDEVHRVESLFPQTHVPHPVQRWNWFQGSQSPAGECMRYSSFRKTKPRLRSPKWGCSTWICCCCVHSYVCPTLFHWSCLHRNIVIFLQVLLWTAKNTTDAICVLANVSCAPPNVLSLYKSLFIQKQSLQSDVVLSLICTISVFCLSWQMISEGFECIFNTELTCVVWGKPATVQIPHLIIVIKINRTVTFTDLNLQKPFSKMQTEMFDLSIRLLLTELVNNNL